jgi:hypothetical protein
LRVADGALDELTPRGIVTERAAIVEEWQRHQVVPEDASHTYEWEHTTPRLVRIYARQIDGLVTEDVRHDLAPAGKVAERAAVRRGDESIPPIVERVDGDDAE